MKTDIYYLFYIYSGYTYEQEVATTTARACGGSHTVTFPHRRTARFK